MWNAKFLTIWGCPPLKWLEVDPGRQKMNSFHPHVADQARANANELASGPSTLFVAVYEYVATYKYCNNSGCNVEGFDIIKGPIAENADLHLSHCKCRPHCCGRMAATIAKQNNIKVLMQLFPRSEALKIMIDRTSLTLMLLKS